MELYKNSEISVHDLKKLVDKNKNIQILDIREDSERKHAFINNSLHIKVSDLSVRFNELDSSKNIFVSISSPILSADTSILFLR